MRVWAWALVIAGTPVALLSLIAVGNWALALMALTQCAFAAFYLVRRVSWLADAIANGTWIGYALTSAAALPDASIETIAAYVGRLAGSLCWSGLALLHAYRTLFRKSERTS